MTYARAPWASTVLTVLFAFAVIPARAAERDIYPSPDRAKIDLAAALTTSAATH